MIKLGAQERVELGKNAVKRLRKNGFLPGVIYGKGRTFANIKIKFTDFERVAKKLLESPDELILKLDDGKEFKVRIKEIQLHPVTDKPIHIDFMVAESTAPP